MKKVYLKYNTIQALVISSKYSESSNILTGTKNMALEAVGRSVSTANPSTGMRSLPQGKPPIKRCATVHEFDSNAVFHRI